MRERHEVPFAFLQDLLDHADEPDIRAADGSADPALAGSKAAVLDATANVLAALRQWLQVTEDMVRLRRDRLIEQDEESPAPAPPQEQRGRERVDLTY